MRNYVREAVDRYMSRIPGAREAVTLDLTYNIQFSTMERLLEVVDMVMEDEGIPEPSRKRIIRTVVYGAPDEYAAHERMAQAEELTDQFSKQGGPIWQPGMPR